MREKGNLDRPCLLARYLQGTCLGCKPASGCVSAEHTQWAHSHAAGCLEGFVIYPRPKTVNGCHGRRLYSCAIYIISSAGSICTFRCTCRPAHAHRHEFIFFHQGSIHVQQWHFCTASCRPLKGNMWHPRHSGRQRLIQMVEGILHECVVHSANI